MVTILFAILNLIPFISTLLNMLFTIKLIVIKLLFIILLPIIFYIVKQFVKRKRLKLSYLRTLKYGSYFKYKIHDENELDITISISLLYFIFFIYLILLNRIKNTEKTFDLSFYLNEISHYYDITPFLEFSTNILIVLYFIILYLFLLSQIIKITKFHFMKLYLYNITFMNKNSWVEKIQQYFLFDNPLSKLAYYLAFHEKINSIYVIKRFFFVHIEGLKLIIHRLILLIIIISDILFNDMVLSHMFKILPYVFIYELWTKVYIFFKAINIPYDEVVASLLYGEKYTLDYDPDCIYIDDKPFEKAFIKELLTEYVKSGFIYKRFTPENPIIGNLKLIVNFWKYYVFDTINEWKYAQDKKL
jgi:hypothetical protein